MLNLGEAHNILEVGCGSCLLVPHALDIKKAATSYLATDLSDDMIEMAHSRLKANLQKYQSSLTYEDWLKSHNLSVRVANGEEPFNSEAKFDRIICNMVMMLT